MEGLSLIPDVIEGPRRAQEHESGRSGLNQHRHLLVWPSRRPAAPQTPIPWPGPVGLRLPALCPCPSRDTGGRLMGSLRKMSSSFKRGSLKSSTSGSQKVSELCLADGRKSRGTLVSSSTNWKAGQWTLSSVDHAGNGVLGVQSSGIRTPSGELASLSCPLPAAPTSCTQPKAPRRPLGVRAVPMGCSTAAPTASAAVRLQVTSPVLMPPPYPLFFITCLWGHRRGLRGPSVRVRSISKELGRAGGSQDSEQALRKLS